MSKKKKENKSKSQNSSKGKGSSYLRFIPIGGMGEVTKNMYVYETEKDMVVVDCGIGFPKDSDSDVNELLIPDFSYVLSKKSKLRALIITHGHEDHIGAVPYFLEKVNVPVYAARLPIGFIKKKLKEKGPKKAKLKELHEEQEVKLGSDFSFELIRLTHSIPDAMAVALKTPLGPVIHTGDFKLDPTPLDRQLAHLGRIEEYGREGTLLLVSDSLRSEREGSSPSERIVGETFFKEIQKTGGRVFITMFSSDISRVQQAIDVASALGRKVTLTGLSLEKNFKVARDLGYLAVPRGQVVSNKKIKKLPVSKQLILVSGSQGQYNSSLSKISRGEHRAFKVGQGDLVIFSSDIIPGNEDRVLTIQEKIKEAGAKIVSLEENPEVHVSGHGYAEDLKKMILAADAKYVIPVGGTEDSTKEYVKLARGYNYKEGENIFPLDSGEILEFYPYRGDVTARIAGQVNLREMSVVQD